MLNTVSVTSSVIVTVLLPEMASNIMFQNNGAGTLRYCFEPDAPTASSGVRLTSGDKLVISGRPDYRLRGAIKFIAESASSTLDVIADAS